ncbi:nuclease-related domain-containing protein [Nocardia sp. NPDC005366]|uniref:nuclease-related domain-containing protein n=1 Tax=Nocardia sp. NPDC005366 TaxID=3156878 RepID=UPI0033B71643
MLVINAERTGIPPTEQRIIGWLRTWTDEYKVAGIAISGCYVPERNNPRTAQETDLVVITPHTCVAVEVKGIIPRAGGELSCSANGRWSLSGVPQDPVHVRKGDTNPINQVSDAFFNLKACAEKAGIEAFVAGLVLVVPHARYPVTLRWSGPQPKGCDVELAGLSQLRQYFRRRAARHEACWSAERVHALLAALGYADRVTPEQLVAEGFPTEPRQSSSAPSPAAASPPAHPPTAPVSPRDFGPPIPASPPAAPIHAQPPPAPPAARTPATAPPPTSPPRAPLKSRPLISPDRPFDVSRPTVLPTDRPRESTVPQRDTATRPRRRRGGVVLLGAAAAIALIGGGIWAVTQGGSDSTEPRQTGDQLTPTTTVEPPAPPPQPTTVPPPPPPPPTERSAPRTPRGCYPFQPDC